MTHRLKYEIMEERTYQYQRILSLLPEKMENSLKLDQSIGYLHL
jgi:hypothetical protein